MRIQKALLIGITLALVDITGVRGEENHVIVIENMKFNPPSLVIHVGDTVSWINKDFFPHTVTSAKRRFDSKEIPANGNWSFWAKATGTFPYSCTLHPTMKAEFAVIK